MKMKWNMSKLVAVFAVSVLLNASAAFAVTWTNWGNAGGNDGNGDGKSFAGTMNFGSSTVNVSLTGIEMDFVNGDYYYNNPATGGTSLAGTYGGLSPSDLIRESGSGRVSITFSEAILDPYISLVSVGAGSNVNYAFQNLQGNPAIKVISFGSNYWNYGGYSINGSTFSGHEYNGILQLDGIYNSLIFDISPNEYWHGFNIGAKSTAPVPEPGTMMLLGIGMLGLAVYGKRRVNKKA